MTAVTHGIGRRVRVIRDHRGLTATGLAAGTGLSKGFISEIENGHSDLSIKNLMKIAKALDVSVAVLVGEAPMPACPTCKRPFEEPPR